MSLKKYLILMLFATIVGWISFVAVLLFIDPNAGYLAIILFYISLSLSLLGTFFLIGFVIRALFKKDIPYFRHLGISFRQSLLFTVLLFGCLILQSADYLRWWNLILFLLFMIILEFFFSISRKPHGR